MNLSNIITGLVDAAKLLAPAIVPGATDAIAAAEKLVGVLNELRGESPAAGEASDDLRARINAHADATADKLKG